MNIMRKECDVKGMGFQKSGRFVKNEKKLAVQYKPKESLKDKGTVQRRREWPNGCNAHGIGGRQEDKWSGGFPFHHRQKRQDQRSM